MAMTVESFFAGSEDWDFKYRIDYADGTTTSKYDDKRAKDVTVYRSRSSLHDECFEFKDGYLVGGKHGSEDWVYTYDENKQLIREKSWDKQGFPEDDDGGFE